MDRTLQFLKELVDTHGAPGFEGDVARVMEKHLKGVGAITRDRLGSNVRWLAAMDGALDHTLMQLPGVESGGPYPFGRQTMLTDWVLNQYFNWAHNSTDVTSVRSETFSP